VRILGTRRGDAPSPADHLPVRLEALDDVLVLAEARLDSELVESATALRTRAGERLAFSGTRTVVALAGATGSGKSSLFNALAGAELSPVGVRRPTTSTTQACVWGADEPSGLLDWLRVGRRLRPSAGRANEPALDGLVLLDLPDHDSTATDHRVEVDRLVARVDLLVWVVDPQKYADAALHERYLSRLADHAAVTLVVLNQVDRLSDEDRARCLVDLAGLLGDDGLSDVEVLPVSAATSLGVAELSARLAGAVSRRLAAAERLSADLDGLARALGSAVPAGSGGGEPGPADRIEIMAALAQVAGVDAVVGAVAAAHRARGVAATGWPPTRWLRRLRADPLRRLHLDRPPAAAGSPVGRTSLPASSSVARSRVELALRRLADSATAGLPEQQITRARAVLRAQTEPLADRLDTAMAGTDLGMAQAPRWWSLGNAVQWLVLLVAVVGGGWLLLDVVLAWLQLPALPSARVGRLALPTLLLAGGLLLGLLAAGVFRLLVRAGAGRRARRARRRLLSAVGEVADQVVLQPLDRELDAWRRLRLAVEAMDRARP